MKALTQYAHIGYLPLVNVETIILVKALVSISVHRGTNLTFFDAVHSGSNAQQMRDGTIRDILIKDH